MYGWGCKDVIKVNKFAIHHWAVTAHPLALSAIAKGRNVCGALAARFSHAELDYDTCRASEFSARNRRKIGLAKGKVEIVTVFSYGTTLSLSRSLSLSLGDMFASGNCEGPSMLINYLSTVICMFAFFFSMAPHAIAFQLFIFIVYNTPFVAYQYFTQECIFNCKILIIVICKLFYQSVLFSIWKSRYYK